MDDPELDGLIHAADLDGLVRLIDARTTGRDWEGLARVRQAARYAVHTGRQVWPAATLAEYRLALWAPAEWAASVLGEDAGRFTIGPLTEVVAQHHTWAELAPHLDPGPRANLVAHERVVRGESLTPPPGPNPFDLPYALADWEPCYVVATYGDEGVEFDAPELPPPAEPLAPTAGDDADVDIDTRAVDDAVRDLVRAWTATSEGTVRVAVGADAGHAVRAIVGPDVDVLMVPLSPGQAVSWLAWAGASGGAHGRRPGAAPGRFGALWLLAALDDATADWPLELDELGEIASSLSWYRWDRGGPETGWILRLVVVDPDNDLAWAIEATDQATA